MTLRKFVFKSAVSLLAFAALAGCMRLPKAQDDFSVLGNDVFSEIIRKAHSEINLTPGDSYGSLGVGKLDKAKAKQLSENFFVGKSKKDLFNIFHENRGKCVAQKSAKIVRCEVYRKWKLENVGAAFDTKYWSDPQAKLDFTFSFSDRDQAESLDLDIIDITEYKVIKG